MAEEWIKMRAALLTHPRFLSLCSSLIYDEERPGMLIYVCGKENLGVGVFGSNENVTDKALRTVTERALRDVTLCALLRVWCAVNAHCKVRGNDALMHPASLADLDVVAGFDGFGSAMLEVGWVKEHDANSLLFPNFLEFNEPACVRRSGKSNAERQKEFRERRKRISDKPGCVTESNESNGRLDKRRIEKREDTPTPQRGEPIAKKPPADPAIGVPIPENLDTPEFRAVWVEWIADRKARRKTLTAKAASLQLADLATLPIGQAIECIRLSMANGWTGIFTDRFRGKSTAQKPPAFLDRGAAQEARMMAQIREAMEDA